MYVSRMILRRNSYYFLNPLKPSGKLYVPAILTPCNAVLCIYGFCMIIAVTKKYTFSKQH